MWIIEEVQRCQEDGLAGVKLTGGLLKLAGDLRSLSADTIDLLPQLVLGPAFLGSQIKKVWPQLNKIELDGDADPRRDQVKRCRISPLAI